MLRAVDMCGSTLDQSSGSVQHYGRFDEAPVSDGPAPARFVGDGADHEIRGVADIGVGAPMKTAPAEITNRVGPS